MKNRTLVIILAIAMVTISASAYGDDDPYMSNGDPNYRYEGSSGTRYQYDLSDPSDRLQYSVDPSAQLRDSVNVNPSVDVDRGMGQYGGGIEW